VREFEVRRGGGEGKGSGGTCWAKMVRVEV